MTERVTDDMIRDWRINYGLDERSPRDAMRWWWERMRGAPAGAVAALGVCLIEIEALRAEVEALRKDAERYAFAKTLEGQVVAMETFKNLGAAALDETIDAAMESE